MRTKDQIPALSIFGIGQSGCLALFFANAAGPKAAYVNFKPRQEHDSIGLDNADLTTMDEITYRAFPYNVSPGRLPDARTNRRMILTYSGDVGLRILDPHFLSHFGGSAGKPGDGACHA